MNKEEQNSVSNHTSMSVELPSSSTPVQINSEKGVGPHISINNRFMTIQGSEGDQKCRLSLFLVKIYECLMNEKLANIMCWTNSGTSF